MRQLQQRSLALTILTRRKDNPESNQIQNSPIYQHIHLQLTQKRRDVYIVNKTTSHYLAETIRTYLLKRELKGFVNTRLVIAVLKVRISVGIATGMKHVTSMVAEQFITRASMVMGAYGKRQPSVMKYRQEMQAEKGLL